jgi:hypothetical protein
VEVGELVSLNSDEIIRQGLGLSRQRQLS